MTEREWTTQRHRTAIGRVGLSAPARQAVVDLQLGPGARALDYGCGRGGDVRALQQLGVEATGWDPVHPPDGEIRPSDVVFLTYVLNVIEDPDERRNTLLDAWRYATSVLIVSTRMRWERNQVSGKEHGDGVLTSRNTFQHLYATDELRDTVQEVTGTRCVSAAPGLIYAFKSDSERLSYFARRVASTPDWLATSDATSALNAVVEYLERRGRLPQVEEMPQDVIRLLGHLRPRELQRLAEQSADPIKREQGAKRAILDTLLFLALELFHGRGPASSLPLPIQMDIRVFFASYKEACSRADRLLYKLRDDALRPSGDEWLYRWQDDADSPVRPPKGTRTSPHSAASLRALRKHCCWASGQLDGCETPAPRPWSELAGLSGIRHRPAPTAGHIVLSRSSGLEVELHHLRPSSESSAPSSKARVPCAG